MSKASLRAKLILKCFVTHDPRVLRKAFSVFVRAIIEFSSVIWNPHFKLDINMIERVLRRFTNAIFPKLTYPVRSSRLVLQTLEMGRTLADLTTCYKLVNNLIDIDCTVFTMATVTRTKGRLIVENYLNIIS